jgi:hypothetical protein
LPSGTPNDHSRGDKTTCYNLIVYAWYQERMESIIEREVPG